MGKICPRAYQSIQKNGINTKMTILFISEHSHIGIGGIANHINNIGKILEIQGHDIVYVNAENLHGKHLFRKKLISPTVIKAKLKSVSPDVIHVHGFSSFFVRQCLSLSKEILPNATLVYTPHYHPFRYHTRPLLATLFFHVLLKSNLKHLDTLIALTESEKDFFAPYMFADKITVIPNGITGRDFSIDKKKPTQKRLLFIGRDDHNKRLDFILAQRDYFAQHQIYCDIVTDRDNVSDDVFTFHKNLAHLQLNELYRNSMIMVIPSKYEAFSIVALEAMSFGLPVLLSDRVQIKSYLNDNEAFNMIFQYDNQNSFLEKLEKILNLSSVRYENYAAANIAFSKRFTWDAIVERIFKMYSQEGASNE